MRLSGKTAVITGGGGVIGAATARRFLAEGAKVALVDRDAAALARAAAGLGGNVVQIAADVTQSADVERYARQAHAALGPVDIFFNNAGIEGRFAPLPDFPEDVWDDVMAVNVKGVFLGLKYMLPRMRDGGSIVITSSTAGLRGSPNFAAYTASKHAVIGLMRTTASEGAARRIRCNTIHPAMVESNMMTRLEDQRLAGSMGNRTRPDVQQEYRSKIPLGRYIGADEIAAAVAYLASDDAAMVTGTQHLVDGGAMLI
ncbi:MAG: SDR family NAD(P)-dependent oxidoreductase [Beijerinckiaceae bacterium]